MKENVQSILTGTCRCSIVYDANMETSYLEMLVRQ